MDASVVFADVCGYYLSMRESDESNADDQDQNYREGSEVGLANEHDYAGAFNER